MPKPIARREDDDETPAAPAAPAAGMDAHLEFVKWIAILTMVIDHAGYLFFDKVDYMTWRSLGRLCWPLIAWIVAVRLYVSPARTMGYLKRLLPWAIVSQIPYGLAFNVLNHEPWYDGFNIFFTIALGCSVLILVQKWDESSKLRRAGIVLAIIAIMLASVRVDYGSIGVATIPVLALLARNYSIRWAAIACGVLASAGNMFVLMTEGLLSMYWLLVLAPLPASILAVYAQNVLIPVPRMPKLFFYLFYPLHLSILLGARIAMDTLSAATK